MRRLLVKNVYDAFDYVMRHCCPAGKQAGPECTDTCAVISIQDSVNGGFGFTFSENRDCLGVLTLIFDDIAQEVAGVRLFSETQAERIKDTSSMCHSSIPFSHIHLSAVVEAVTVAQGQRDGRCEKTCKNNP